MIWHFLLDYFTFLFEVFGFFAIASALFLGLCVVSAFWLEDGE